MPAEIFRIVHAEFKNLCHAPARGEACAAIRLLWIIIEPEAFKGAEIQWVAFVNLLVGEAAQEFFVASADHAIRKAGILANGAGIRRFEIFLRQPCFF